MGWIATSQRDQAVVFSRWLGCVGGVSTNSVCVSPGRRILSDGSQVLASPPSSLPVWLARKLPVIFAGLEHLQRVHVIGAVKLSLDLKEIFRIANVLLQIPGAVAGKQFEQFGKNPFRSFQRSGPTDRSHEKSSVSL